MGIKPTLKKEELNQIKNVAINEKGIENLNLVSKKEELIEKNTPLFKNNSTKTNLKFYLKPSIINTQEGQKKNKSFAEKSKRLLEKITDYRRLSLRAAMKYITELNNDSKNSYVRKYIKKDTYKDYYVHEHNMRLYTDERGFYLAVNKNKKFQFSSKLINVESKFPEAKQFNSLKSNKAFKFGGLVLIFYKTTISSSLLKNRLKNLKGAINEMSLLISSEINSGVFGTKEESIYLQQVWSKKVW